MDKPNWLEWSKESFEKSKKEKKPILLSISAIWCHWCHRLDKDTYSSTKVIDKINNNFIPIRVDTDKRPDINNRYNLGGWPSTAILNKEGGLILGALYLPPFDMLDFLDNALEKFKKEIKEEIIFELPKFNNTDLQKMQQEILSTIELSYDPYFGGFGPLPKFPNHQIIDFLMMLFDEEKNARVILTKTLSTMADNEIFDKEEGGFYRYAQQQDWSSPHYEKLLDDNARLLKNFLYLYKLTENEKYKEVALKTINFIIEVFLNKEKTFFYSSQDADEKYSKLTLKQRSEYKKPFIDKTLFLAFNCYAINSFLIASEILKDSRYGEIALKILDFIIVNMVSGKGVMHFYDSKAREPCLLKNHLLLISSLLSTNEKKYMGLAEKLIEKTINNFFDKNKTVFYDIQDSEDNFGYLKIRRIDTEENSLAVKILLALYKKTNNKEYLEKAEKLLNSIKDYIDTKSLSSASFAEAINLYSSIIS